jgi:hypothetical protein
MPPPRDPPDRVVLDRERVIGAGTAHDRRDAFDLAIVLVRVKEPSLVGNRKLEADRTSPPAAALWWPQLHFLAPMHTSDINEAGGFEASGSYASGFQDNVCAGDDATAGLAGYLDAVGDRRPSIGRADCIGDRTGSACHALRPAHTRPPGYAGTRTRPRMSHR